MRLDALAGNKRILYLGLFILFLAIPLLFIGFHMFIQPLTQLPLDPSESQALSPLAIICIIAGGVCLLLGLFCAHVSLPKEEQESTQK